MPHAPEQGARQQIDRQLAECGWSVRDFEGSGRSNCAGAAIRQFPLKHGHADYVLFVDDMTAASVAILPTTQTMMNPRSRPPMPMHDGSGFLAGGVVAFAYLSTGTVIRFTNYLEGIAFTDMDVSRTRNR